MIQGFDITNCYNEKLHITLGEAEPDHGLLLIKAEGLGPVQADINTTDLATRDGSKFNSARAQERNITFTFRFIFANTIEDARQLSYKYFPLKRNLNLKVTTDNRILETNGYVESNEPEIWSEQEETTISIICPDPWFYEAFQGSQQTDFYGVTPLFEFPFENDSLTEELIEFGQIEIKTERVVIYEGDAEVGIVIRIKASGPTSNITFYKIDTREKLVIDVEKIEDITGYGITAADEIIISTIRGEKSAVLFRNGIYYNILNAVDRYANWFELKKGDNIFVFDTDINSNLQVSIINRIAYEGI